MPYWLMKSEPDEFSIQDLKKLGHGRWDGVRNYAARNTLRAMQEGDLMLFYHSGEDKCVKGIAKVKKTAYPAVMVTTGDHDDRVVPAHSFKFAASLQAAQTGKSPVLISIETKAGHGAGKPTDMLISEQADKWAFLFWNMGINPQP